MRTLFNSMKSTTSVSLAAVAIVAASLGVSLHAQVPASPPGPGLTVVNVPLLVPGVAGPRPTADIAHVEVRLAHGVGGAVFTQRVPPEAGRVLQAVSVQIEKLHPGPDRCPRRISRPRASLWPSRWMRRSAAGRRTPDSWRSALSRPMATCGR